MDRKIKQILYKREQPVAIYTQVWPLPLSVEWKLEAMVRSLCTDWQSSPCSDSAAEGRDTRSQHLHDDISLGYLTLTGSMHEDTIAVILIRNQQAPAHRGQKHVLCVSAPTQQGGVSQIKSVKGRQAGSVGKSSLILMTRVLVPGPTEWEEQTNP